MNAHHLEPKLLDGQDEGYRRWLVIQMHSLASSCRLLLQP